VKEKAPLLYAMHPREWFEVYKRPREPDTALTTGYKGTTNSQRGSRKTHQDITVVALAFNEPLKGGIHPGINSIYFMAACKATLFAFDVVD